MQTKNHYNVGKSKAGTKNHYNVGKARQEQKITRQNSRKINKNTKTQGALGIRFNNRLGTTNSGNGRKQDVLATRT